MEPALETFGPSICFVSLWKQIRRGPPWKCLSHGTALTARYLSNRPSLTSQLASFNGSRYSLSRSRSNPEKKKKEVRCSRDPRRERH